MIIETRHLKATDTRSSRIKASTPYGQTLTVGWNYALDTLDNHQAVAEQLAYEPVKLVETTARGYIFRTAKES